MMQEEELVIRDDFPKSKNSCPDQDIVPFTISDGSQNGLAKKYTFTLFEMFVTSAVMLSTISGGFLEGYTSPAIPSMLESNNTNSTWPNASSVSVPLSHSEASYVLEGTPRENNSTNSSSDALQRNNSLADTDESGMKFTIEEGNTLKSPTYVNISAAQENENKQPTPEMSVPLALEGLDEGTNNGTIMVTSTQSQTLHVTEEEGSWLASLLLLGGALGATASPWLVRLGRRHAIILSAAPRFLGWLLIALSSSVYSIYAGRFLCGVSIGAVSSATSIYISEVAHPSLRGSLSCVVILGVNVGIFIASLLGTFMKWRGLAVAGAVSVVAYLVPFLCVPNSPSWLVLRRREDEARAALRKLRGRSYCVEDELQQVISVCDSTTKSKSASWKEIVVERRTLLPLGVVLLVTTVNRLSGYNAIITFCSSFIHEAVPAVSQYWAAVSVCLVQIVATLGAMSLVDSWGRRKLLLSSVTMMGVSLMVIAACEAAASARGGGTWVAVLATMTYVGAYSIGVGPLTFVLLGELFPLDARDRATAIVVVANWGLAFLVTKTYFSLEASVGLSGTCLIYASVCVTGAVAFFFLVPETKGRTLSEIEAYFSYPRGRTWGPPSVGPVDHALSGILDMEGTSLETYSTFH